MAVPAVPGRVAGRGGGAPSRGTARSTCVLPLPPLVAALPPTRADKHLWAGTAGTPATAVMSLALPPAGPPAECSGAVATAADDGILLPAAPEDPAVDGRALRGCWPTAAAAKVAAQGALAGRRWPREEAGLAGSTSAADTPPWKLKLRKGLTKLRTVC